MPPATTSPMPILRDTPAKWRNSAKTPRPTGDQVSGGGVSLDGLQSVRDELLNLQIQQQTSLQSSADTQSSTSSADYKPISPRPPATTSASELAAFSSSLSQLSASPTSSAAQQGVISAGQDLANAFNTTANGLTSAQSYADGQVTQTVAQINSLTSADRAAEWTARAECDGRE